MMTRKRSNFVYLSLQSSKMNTCCWIFAVAVSADAKELVPLLEYAVGYYSCNHLARLNIES